MKNLQKIAVALLVGIMAIGFSAFTSIKPTTTQVKNLRAIPAGFLVQVSDGLYEYRSSIGSGNCDEPADNACHYTVQSSNTVQSGKTQWTQAEIETYSGVVSPAGGNFLFTD